MLWYGERILLDFFLEFFRHFQSEQPSFVLSLVPHTSVFNERVYLYLTLLSEHTNCWTKLTAITMPDCTSHTTEINPLSWKTKLLWAGTKCTFGWVLVSEDWNQLQYYYKGEIKLWARVRTFCVLILVIIAGLRGTVALMMQVLHLRWKNALMQNIKAFVHITF